MSKLIIEPTSTAQWQALIREAEHTCTLDLETELESYLVFLLMRFVDNPNIGDSILGKEWLDALVNQMGHQCTESLQAVGDKCLIFSGLFPGLARRRRVPIHYYVDLGMQAYATLAERSAELNNHLYMALSHEFVSLMDVLQATREPEHPFSSLDLLQAEELWHDTGSLHAKRTLELAIHDIHRLAESSSRKS